MKKNGMEPVQMGSGSGGLLGPRESAEKLKDYFKEKPEKLNF